MLRAADARWLPLMLACSCTCGPVPVDPRCCQAHSSNFDLTCTTSVHVMVSDSHDKQAYEDQGATAVSYQLCQGLAWGLANLGCRPLLDSVHFDLRNPLTAAGGCRTNASCALNIQPCLLNNQVITTVDLVKDLPFTALPFTQFFDGYVGCPANNLVRAAPHPPPHSHGCC